MRIQQRIEAALTSALSPQQLVVINESQRHRAGPDAESHFTLTVISDAFQGQSLVQRHRSVYAALGPELTATIHALSIKTLTPAEWHAEQAPQAHKAPACRGGSANHEH